MRAVRDREQEQHEQEGQEGARAIQAPAGRGTQFTSQGAIPGVDLSDVRAHAGPSASERAFGAGPAQISALAYTQGRDVHVGPGAPAAVPHEAAHVVQQSAPRAAAPVAEDEGLEHEADEMGARVQR